MPQTQTELIRYRQLTDADILTIMHQHQAYRELKIRYDEMYPNGASTEGRTPDQLAMIEYYNRPLMGDEAFLAELHTIMGGGPPLCSTVQVAKIHTLRSVYEFVPPDKNGKYPSYQPISIRIRVKEAKERAREGRSSIANELLPMTPEMQFATFGSTIHSHRFLLRDVLAHHIGRWPVSARVRDGAEFLFGEIDMPYNDNGK